MDEPFGPARALRDVWTSRGRGWRLAHRVDHTRVLLAHRHHRTTTTKILSIFGFFRPDGRREGGACGAGASRTDHGHRVHRGVEIRVGLACARSGLACGQLAGITHPPADVRRLQAARKRWVNFERESWVSFELDLTLHRSRSTENVRRLEKEAARLQGLLNAAGIDSGRHSMTGMRKEMSRLKDVIARQAEELKELKAENERLRSARETHAKARFGRKSEKKKKKKSGSGRKRGQQADTPGHGPTPRSDMDRKSEVHDPPEEERVCPCCGLPYVKNGSHDSEFIEVEVKAHVRTIRRNRWRRSCTCASAPKEVAVPHKR